MKKIILSAFLAGFVMFVASLIMGYGIVLLFPSIGVEYQNTALYRQMSDPISSLFLLHPFLVGIILAFVWNKTKSLFETKKFMSRGVQFGLMYFVIVIPGLLISYACSPYSLLMVATWTVSVMINSILSGLVFEKING